MSSSETESDGEPKKKRTCNPTKYKRNVIKNSKVKGQAHTNYRGKQIAPRSTGENCRQVYHKPLFSLRFFKGVYINLIYRLIIADVRRNVLRISIKMTWTFAFQK